MGTGTFLYLGLFIASLNPTYEKASDTARRGLVETQMMKDEIKRLEEDSEQILFNYTGLLKEDLVYAGYAYPIFIGKLSTKPFKNFKYETKDKWSIRPDFEYGLWNKESTVILFITKEF